MCARVFVLRVVSAFGRVCADRGGGCGAVPVYIVGVISLKEENERDELL